MSCGATTTISRSHMQRMLRKVFLRFGARRRQSPPWARRPETPIAASARPSARHDPGSAGAGGAGAPKWGGRGLHAVAGRQRPGRDRLRVRRRFFSPTSATLCTLNHRRVRVCELRWIQPIWHWSLSKTGVADPMNRRQRHPMKLVSPSEIPSAAAHYDEHWTGYRTAAAARVVVCGAVCGVVGR
jgi:hypothetical protein